MSRYRFFGAALSTAALASALTGCGAEDDFEEGLVARTQQAVSAPIAKAHCSINVIGKGVKDMETDYLPHVITCENGGANLQALKAQAIAARSVAYYNIATSGSICDSQGCQVYGCGATVSAKAKQAVAETAGMYLSYANLLTYGFYVAGDSSVDPPACKDVGGTTTKYVTFNEGKTGTSVQQTSLGYIGPPGYGQNRGCMSQWGARCLENSKGYDYKKILQFYYGSDIKILQATGPCTNTCTPKPEVCNGLDDDCDGQKDEGGVCNKAPKGYLDAADCDSLRGWAQDPDAPDKPIDVHLYFGGPAGSGAKSGSVLADVNRNDLCSAIGSCKHGFDIVPPLSLFDGVDHPVHAYGIDSAGGTNTQLTNSPRPLNCTAQVPVGVRRHVINPESLGAWGFDLFWQLLPLSDAQIASLDEGAALPAGPELVRGDDGAPEVWLRDGKYRRHVPDPSVLAAWGFSMADVTEIPASDIDALSQGPDLRASPVLVRDSEGKVELIDDPFPGSGTGMAGYGNGVGGGSGAGGSGGGSGGGKQQKTSVYGDDDAEGSCGCRTPGATPSSSWPLAALLLGWMLRRRRR